MCEDLTNEFIYETISHLGLQRFLFTSEKKLLSSDLS